MPRITISELPTELVYVGEYGTELICFLPFVYWLHLTGNLVGRKVSTYKGMKSYYFFLDTGVLVEREEVRRHVNLVHRPSYWPNRHEHFATRNPLEAFPDFRIRYENDIFKFEKKILIVNNKFVNEWGIGPVNSISPALLDRVFSRLHIKFQIIYVRQGLYEVPSSFSADHNEVLPFDDISILQKYPNVMIFDDLLRRFQHLYDYNTLKNMLYANCYHYISSQSGGNYLTAYYKKSMLLVFHRAGEETRFSYAEGFYKYISNPSIVRLVARNDEEFINGIDVFDAECRCRVSDSMLCGLGETVGRLSPASIEDVEARIAEIQADMLKAG